MKTTFLQLLLHSVVEAGAVHGAGGAGASMIEWVKKSPVIPISHIC